MAEPDVILTPDQRVRVFISSTLGELAAERAAARRAITRLHLVPVWYESGARPHPPRNMYRAYVEQSQVFVGIYWQRYGWVAPGMEISGLEDEFRLAAGKPMLLYLKRPVHAPGRVRPGAGVIPHRHQVQPGDRPPCRGPLLREILPRGGYEHPHPLVRCQDHICTVRRRFSARRSGRTCLLWLPHVQVPLAVKPRQWNEVMISGPCLG